jgi:pimeloyl-ACP methyl ester carboxylesterase
VALRGAGFEVIAPDCRGQDLGARVRVIEAELCSASVPLLVVGSSFGGIAGLLASLAAADRGVFVPGLVLLAPALHLPPDMLFGEGPTRPLRPPAPTVIVHGRADSIIPIDVSRRFAAEHGAALHEVDDDHRLGGSLDFIVEVVRQALAPTSAI